MKLLEEFPVKQQRNKHDCSVCVMWCVLQYSGFEFPYREMYNFVDPPTDPDVGVTGDEIIQILKKFGIKAIHEKGSISDLQFYTKNKIPIIASIQHRKERNKSWKNTQKYGHYIVVLSVEKGKVKYMDPNYGEIKTLKTKEFQERWHDGDEFPIIVCYIKDEN